jgi:hypothetical protein
VPELWTPGNEGPLDQLVDRLLRTIATYARENGVEHPVVEVELADTGRFALESISAEPGFGFVTLRVHCEEDDAPELLIVPVGSLRRIELRRTRDDDVPFGFSLPEQRE